MAREVHTTFQCDFCLRTHVEKGDSPGAYGWRLVNVSISIKKGQYEDWRQLLFGWCCPGCVEELDKQVQLVCLKPAVRGDIIPRSAAIGPDEITPTLAPGTRP